MTWLMYAVGPDAARIPAPMASTNICPMYGRPVSIHGRELTMPTTPTEGSPDMTSTARVKIVGSMTAAPVTSSGFCTVP
jgi:hypothetical protein